MKQQNQAPLLDNVTVWDLRGEDLPTSEMLKLDSKNRLGLELAFPALLPAKEDLASSQYREASPTELAALFKHHQEDCERWQSYQSQLRAQIKPKGE